MLQEQQTLPPGTTIQDRNGERYVVESIVGQGGFSAVYVVRDRRARQRIFALKELINPSSQERYQLAFEAEILRRVSHRSLPRVYKVFENDGLNRVYMLMDYIEGKNLEALRREQPEHRFSLALTLVLLTPIVEAVIYLHRQETPIIHRDIKPSNIIIPVGMGDAVLVDFGLAKEYVKDKTTNIFRYGTPGYAAPEQYGQGTNLSTDIYALGATLYTLLTGVIPVDALTRVMDRWGDPLPAADQVNPHIPSRIAQVITKAMSLHSQDRYSSVEAFWQTLSTTVVQAETYPLSPEQGLKAISSSSLPPLSPEDIQILATTRMAATRASHAQRNGMRGTPRLNYARPARRRMRLRKAIAALVLAAVIINGLFLLAFGLAFNRPHQPSSHAVSGPNSAQKTVRPSPTVEFNPYPVLAVNYAGTIYDTGVGKANGSQLMRLNNIQQKQDNISGSFQGLGLTLPFEGKVTKDQKINFKVFIAQTGVTLLFSGDIKVGGDIVGSFQSRGPDGQDVQEYGPWNLHQDTALAPPPPSTLF